MSHQVKCDRCGAVGEREVGEEDRLLPNWNVVDDCDLCPDCDAAFREFIRNGREEPTNGK